MTQGMVDTASKAIVQVGFSIVVAGVLLWFIIGRLTTDLDRILGEMQQHTKELREQTQLMKDFVREKRE